MTNSMQVVFESREEFEEALQLCNDYIDDWIDISDDTEIYIKTIKLLSYKYDVASRSITLFYEDELLDN